MVPIIFTVREDKSSKEIESQKEYRFIAQQSGNKFKKYIFEFLT